MRMRMMSKTAWGVLASLTVLLALAVCACSSSGGKACKLDTDCKPEEYCATNGTCMPRANNDGGQDGNTGGDGDGNVNVDNGPPPCANDRDCPPDKVCDTSSHACVAGQGCSADYNCDIATQYCDPTGKVCKKRSLLCEPCTGDYQCPDPGMGDKCIDYTDGKYCGQKCNPRACPTGYICDNTISQCRTNTGICGQTKICHSDADCAPLKICNPSTGYCVAKCITDSNCPAGQRCHYTGHCAAPCTKDADCGQDLICCTGPGTPVSYCDANSTGKCRPAGCVLHSECLVQSGDSYGYCDTTTHTCMAGCRAADPATINDCHSGMKCSCTNGTVGCDVYNCCPDPAESGACLCDPTRQSCAGVTVCNDGQCVKIPCNERGDVSIACARNDLCCGWPSDGYTCPSGTNTGDCYQVDANTWCAPCSDEGKSCNDGSVLGHGNKGVCQTDSKDSNKYCYIGCRDSQDCPSTWVCKFSFMQGCDQDSDCTNGAPCTLVGKYKDNQGQAQDIKACVCTDDSQCPQDFNGFAGQCLSTSICDSTVTPPTCNTYKVCEFAKACQCPTCCADLHSGG